MHKATIECFLTRENTHLEIRRGALTLVVNYKDAIYEFLKK